MATKLENRVPFMDHKLVEFTMSLPPKILFNRFQTKAILRSFLKKGGFTKDIVERRKTGFTLPVDVWFKTELRQSIEENLNSLKRRQLFSPQTIDKIWNIFLTNRIHRERIWQLISIEYWFQNFIDNKDFLKVQRA